MEVDAKVVWQGVNAILFFVFTHADFTDQQLYVANRYIHVTEKGTEDSLFILSEAFIPAAGYGGVGALVVSGNVLTDGAEANDAPKLLSARTSSLGFEYMADLFYKSISINYDNDPAPDNFPRQGETTAGAGNWRREGIICRRKSGNLQNSFASFGHYSHDAVLPISLLQLFLITFPEDYLEKVLIPETNKGLSGSMDLQEFIKWVGCWIYMI